MRIRTVRRKIAALSIATALTLTLAACGGGSAGDATAGGDKSAGAKVSGQITLLTPIYEGSKGKALLEGKLLPQFYKQYPDVKVTVDYTTYGKLNEKLTTAVASSLIPDVMMMGVGWVENFASHGVLADLSKRGMTPDSLKGKYNDEILRAGMWKGNVYAVPIMLDTRFGVARKDLLAAGGFDAPPKTWQELEDMAKALTVRAPDGTLTRAGLDVLSLDPRQMFETMLFSAGGDLFNKDISAPAFNSKEGVMALQFVSDLISKHKVEDAGFSSPGAGVNPLLNGRAAMGIAHNNLWTQAQEAAPKVLDQLVPFVIQGEAPGMFFGGTLATMAKTSKNPAAAQALLEFLSGPGPALAANEQRGNVPALTELLDSDYVKGNTLVQFAMNNLDSAKREGGPPQWLEIRGDFKPAIESALLGKMTPQQALDDLAASAQKAMDR